MVLVKEREKKAQVGSGIMWAMEILQPSARTLLPGLIFFNRDHVVRTYSAARSYNIFRAAFIDAENNFLS